MEAAVQSAAREALSGASGLYQESRSSSSSAITADVRLTSFAEGLVPVYGPSTAEKLSVLAWTESVNDLATAYASSDKQTTSFAITKVQGAAKAWIDSLLTVHLTWPERNKEL